MSFFDQRRRALNNNRGGGLVRNPVAPPPRPAARPAASAAPVSAEQWLKNERQIGQQSAAGDPSGIFGRVLNTPIAAGFLNTVDFLDKGRRAVTLGFEELAEGITGEEFLTQVDENGNVIDDRSNWDKINDPTYGVGQLIRDVSFDDSLGNFFDKGVGFTGDVAFDPLTYLTMGVGKAAGLGGRAAAAAKLTTAAKAAERAGDAAGAARLAEGAARAGRIGISGLDDDLRKVALGGADAAVNDTRAGLRFSGMRIPGTGGIARGTGTGLNTVRAKVGDVLPETVSGLRYEKGLQDSYRGLNRGTGNAMEHAAEISSRHSRTAGETVTTNLFGKRSADVGERLSKMDGDASGEFAYALDEGVVLPELGDAKQLFDDTGAHWVKETAGEATLRDNYVQHIMSKEGRDAAARDGVFDVSDGAGFVTSTTKARGAAKHRSIQPGTTLENPRTGVKVTFVGDLDDGRRVSLRQKQQKMSELLEVDKAYHDELSKILPQHVGSIAENIGTVRAVKRVGEMLGIDPEDARNLVDEIDVKATNAQAKSQKKLAQQIGKLTEHNRSVVRRGADQTAAKIKKTLLRNQKDEIKRLESKVADVNAKVAKSKGDVAAKHADDLNAARRELENAKSQLKRIDEFEANELARIDQRALEGKREADAVRKRQKRAVDRGEPTAIPGGRNAPYTQQARAEREALQESVSARRTAVQQRLDEAAASKSAVEQQIAREAKQVSAAFADELTSSQDALAAVRKARTNLKKRTTNNRTNKQMTSLYADLETVAKQAGTYPGSEATEGLLSTYAAQLAAVEGLTDDIAGNAKKIAAHKKAEKASLDKLRKLMRDDPDFKPVLKQVVRDHFERLGPELLGDDAPWVSRRMYEWMNNFNQVVDDKSFFSAIDTYTAFFKTYATMTPGFHVRNGMSASFMNAVEGVGVKQMIDGVRIWKKLHKDPGHWADNFDFESLGYTRKQVEDALEMVYGSGGGSGQYGSIELGKAADPTRKGNILQDNRLTRFSASVGGQVEGAVRLGMALDTVLGGGAFDEGVARIARVHFDYSSVSTMDEKMKRLIPFWTFMSRNVPLQIQNMVSKPRVYQWYNSFARNMGNDYQDDEFIPTWWQPYSFRLTDNVLAQPDLAHTGLRDDMAALTMGLSEGSLANPFEFDPSATLAGANPLIKGPIESYVANKSSFTGAPIESIEDGGGITADEEGPLISMLAPFLRALGQGGENADGEPVLDERAVNFIRSLLPVEGQVRRVAPTEDKYKDRWATSVAGYTGLPLRFMNDKVRENEERRRSFDR